MQGILLCASLSLFGADFSICSANGYQFNPAAVFAQGQYYVFWEDYRFELIDSTYAVFGARVSAAGAVLDPNGKLLLRDSAVDPRAAYDGTNILVVLREGHC